MDARTSINNSAYGGIADSYASKYGIPTDVFRSAINSVSGFDPLQTSATGKGIANLNTSSKISGLDPMSVDQSLDFAARYIADEYKTVGDWTKAAESFTGNLGTSNDSEMQYDAMGNATGTTAKTIYEPTSQGGILGSIVSFLKSSAFNIVLILIGAVLILGSVWILVKTSGDTK